MNGILSECMFDQLRLHNLLKVKVDDLKCRQYSVVLYLIIKQNVLQLITLVVIHFKEMFFCENKFCFCSVVNILAMLNLKPEF